MAFVRRRLWLNRNPVDLLAVSAEPAGLPQTHSHNRHVERAGYRCQRVVVLRFSQTASVYECRKGLVDAVSG